MISAEKEAAILRLHYAEKWPAGTIATQLGVHHSTARRVLAQAGLEAGKVLTRPSKAEPYLSFVQQMLKEYPRLRASRLYRMVKERGYTGGEDHFRSIVARYRTKPAAEAFLRVRTLPGEQAQVDWGHFGTLSIGAAKRTLYGFVMVLSYSRQVFLSFSLSAAMPSFVRGHVDAFGAFGGVPRVLLYDNLKSAVLERAGEAIRFHPTLLALATHYHFLPKPVAPARGNEKGRVERAIRYIRDAFFAARTFADVADLNAQACAWCTGEAAARRCPEDRSRLVHEVFADERAKLLPLPETPFEAEERVEVQVGKTPYVRFDLNDYSIPYTHVRRTLVVVATSAQVRVLDGTTVLAEHARCWNRGVTVEDARHVAELVERKRRAAKGQGIERLHHAVPPSRALLAKVADRGGNLGTTVYGLMRLLESHGAEALGAAVDEALARDAPHLGAIRQSLDRARHARGQPPLLAVPLPPDPRLRDLIVVPHALDSYDQLGGERKGGTR